jgi:hypothetical protein
MSDAAQSHADGAAPADGAFAAYARGLWKHVRASRDRVPTASPGDLEAELAAMREADARASDPPPARASAPERREPVAAPAPPVSAPRSPGAARFGLSALEAAWPASRLAELESLLADFAAVDRLFALRPGVPSHRAAGALASRADLAVRWVSSQMYLAARDAGVAEDAVERAAIGGARVLGERLFGDPRRVYAVQRGLLVESEQEIVGADAPGGRVRPAGFGMRDGSGSVIMKAPVEADPSASGRLT